MSLHVFGIRHHGPGCARALRTALEALSPDVLLVEGPPDAAEALALIGDAGMVPPVALLVHSVDNPQRALFYPFAEFSPEWQALRFASERKIPSRFMDLPCANLLALESQKEQEKPGESDEPPEAVEESVNGELDSLREDPIGLLAEAAGFKDHEQWWDYQVEQRVDAVGLFESLLEGMAAIREEHVERRTKELAREAHMRTVIRAAQKEGFQRIAVVCGAWHAPKLAVLGPAKSDAEQLKGLPKIKVAATWIPWTYSRLAYRSGYGAGVDSPGWYAHVWKHGDRAPVVWVTLAARLLRSQDLDASAANVIETVRLASTLASVRDLPTPGLRELREAIEAVLCGGEPARLALIRKHLEIGESLGEVPEDAGQVPLARDFEREAKRLRLKLSAEQLQLELDLRKDLDRERSRLIHRVRVLGLEWGRVLATGRSAGTFREAWQLGWRPELAVDLIAANIHGNTVEVAATSAMRQRANNAELAELTKMVEVAILAYLPVALDALLNELDARAATSSDVRLQMEALEPLARIVRYSDVRETRAEHVLPVLTGLFERVVVSLVPACTQLDDDAAAGLMEAIGHAHAACLLLDDPALKTDWLEALRALMEGGAVHGRIAGRACRLLLEQHALAEGELAKRASLALSPGVEPAQAAQWVEGLVAGEGLLLTHQHELLVTLDTWVACLSDEAFQGQLPLLRRAFAGLQAPEKRAVAQTIKRGQSSSGRPKVAGSEALDEARMARVMPVLAHILGVSHD